MLFNKGDYPKNLQVVFCPNKQCYFEPFMDFELFNILQPSIIYWYIIMSHGVVHNDFIAALKQGFDSLKTHTHVHTHTHTHSTHTYTQNLKQNKIFFPFCIICYEALNLCS